VISILGMMSCTVNRNIEGGAGADHFMGGRDAVGGVSIRKCEIGSGTDTLGYSKIAGRNFSWMSQTLF